MPLFAYLFLMVIGFVLTMPWLWHPILSWAAGAVCSAVAIALVRESADFIDRRD
jgi:hypothetical protein